MPDIYIKIWVELGPHDATCFIGYGLIAVSTCFLGFLHHWWLYTQLSPRASASLHNDLVQTTMHSTHGFLSTAKTGTILNLFSQDMTLVSRSLPGAFLGTIYAGSNSIINMGIILAGASHLSLTLPVFLICLFFVQRYYLRTSRQVRHLDLEMKTPLYTFFEETATGMSHIQAFHWEEKNIEHGLCLLDESQKPFYTLSAIQQWLGLVLSLITATLGTFLVLLALLVRSGSSQSGVGLSFLSLIFLSDCT